MNGIAHVHSLFTKGWGLPLVHDLYTKFGSVFTINLYGPKVTLLIGPEVSAHFFQGLESEISVGNLYDFTIPIFGQEVFHGVDTATSQWANKLHRWCTKVIEAAEPRWSHVSRSRGTSKKWPWLYFDLPWLFFNLDHYFCGFIYIFANTPLPDAACVNSLFEIKSYLIDWKAFWYYYTGLLCKVGTSWHSWS